MGKWLGTPSEWTKTVTSPNAVKPLPGVHASPEFTQITEKHSQQCAKIIAQTHDQTENLNSSVPTDIRRSSFKKREANKGVEINSVINKAEAARQKAEAIADRLKDEKEFNADVDEIRCMDGCDKNSSDASNILKNAKALVGNKLTWAKGSAKLRVTTDTANSNLTQKEKDEVSKQTGRNLDATELNTAQEKLEQAKSNEELMNLSDDLWREQKYNESREALSLLFFEPGTLDEEGKPKQLSKKQFETIVHTLMNAPDIQTKISSLESKNPNIKLVHDSYKQGLTHGQSQGYAILLKVLSNKGLVDRMQQDSFIDEIWAYQQENKDQFQDTGKIYTGSFSTVNLTRIYTEEFLKGIAEEKQSDVSWQQIRDKIAADDRIHPSVKETLYTNFNSIIENEENPAQYLNRVENDILRENEGKLVSVNTILANQGNALRNADESTIQFIDIPQLLKQPPAEFLNQANTILLESADRFGSNDEAAKKRAKKEATWQMFGMLDPNLQKKLSKFLVETDPSYREVFQEIQQERIERGEEPFAFEISKVQDADDTNSQARVGESYSISPWRTGEVFQTSAGEPSLIAIPKNERGALLLTPEAAQDTQTVERLTEEFSRLWIKYFYPEELMQILKTWDDAREMGGVWSPDRAFDLTDGIDMLERSAYLNFRRFIQHIQTEAGVSHRTRHDDLLSDKFSAESSTTTEDERMRLALLGYSSNEGIFQRDVLMDKIRSFWANETTSN